MTLRGFDSSLLLRTGEGGSRSGADCAGYGLWCRRRERHFDYRVDLGRLEPANRRHWKVECSWHERINGGDIIRTRTHGSSIIHRCPFIIQVRYCYHLPSIGSLARGPLSICWTVLDGVGRCLLFDHVFWLHASCSMLVDVSPEYRLTARFDG